MQKDPCRERFGTHDVWRENSSRGHLLEDGPIVSARVIIVLNGSVAGRIYVLNNRYVVLTCATG